MKRKPVSVLRWLFGLGAIAAIAMVCLTAAQASWLLAIPAAMVLTVTQSSFAEWLVHRYLYHSRLPGFAWIAIIHHNGHHSALFPPHRYVWSGRYEHLRMMRPYMPFRMAKTWLENAHAKWGQVLMHFVIGLATVVAPAVALGMPSAFVGTTIATLAGLSWLLAHVHGAIHTPRDRWVERQAWFKWLDQHHYVHHIDLAVNVNFMLPLCDFLFATRKAELSAEEAARHPSFAEAKRLPAPARAETRRRARSRVPARLQRDNSNAA